LTDLYVNELIAVYPTRDEAVQAMKTMVAEEPDWDGMLEVVAVADRRRCLPKCRRVLRPPRCGHARR
jgi:hypothetical protein